MENTIEYEEIPEQFVCTHIRLKTTERKPIDLFTYYRSPTPNCKIYEKLFSEGGGAKKFYQWFKDDLHRIYNEYDDVIVLTDANIDLWRTPPLHQIEKSAQSNIREYLLKKWNHLTDGIVTCLKSENGSTVDWILTKNMHSILNFKSEDITTTTIKFDHVLFSFEIKCSANKIMTQTISIKSKVPKCLTPKQAEQFVEPINRRIMQREIEEIEFKRRHGLLDWTGDETYLKNEELPIIQFLELDPSDDDLEKRYLR